MKRFGAICLILVLFAAILPIGIAAETPQEAVILFTHDMHDHFDSFTDSDGTQYGGFRALSSTLNQRRASDKNAIVVDAGDSSMGTLFQTLYATHAPELNLLGMMGYDVITFGNHEFDYRAEQLANMLMVAKDFESAPQIVLSNYKPAADTAPSVQKALDAYGVKEYTILEKGNVRYAVFGITGVDAHACAPMSGFELEDPIDAAKRIVKEIQENETYDLILCLSHSGTSSNTKKSEDELLAKAVPAIDVIISGHTHTTLEAPIVVGNTYIVSAGSYSKNLGELRLTRESERWSLSDYTLTELSTENPSVRTDYQNEAISAQIEAYRTDVTNEYLSTYGMKFDQVLTTTDFALPEQNTHGELRLGNLISDSYVYAVKQAMGADYIPVDVAVVPNGVIRGGFFEGNITVSDAFNVSSLGIGADGSVGYPLLSIYLTGKELVTVMEIDASIAPLMDTAQLYMSGVQYTFNPNRMILDKVTAYNLIDESGVRSAVEEDKLYHVVAGLYSAQMLGAVTDVSKGILSIVPKDANGAPIEDFEAHIIHDQSGNELKEWYALASYLQSFASSGLPARYAAAEGRKTVENSRNPINLIKYPGLPTILVLLVLLLILALLIVLVYHLTHRKRRRGGRSRNAYRRYRG